MDAAYCIAGIVRLWVGSFVNVCKRRIPGEFAILGPRSFYPSCFQRLRWHELFPVASLGGKCRRCRARIPWTYAHFEIASCLLAFLVLLTFGASIELLWAICVSLLMFLIAVIDWQRLVIPDAVTLAAFFVGILFYVFFDRNQMMDRGISSLCAFALMAAIRFLGVKALGREALGMGDVKLSAVIALFLGFVNFLFVLWLAATIGLLIVLANKSVQIFPVRNRDRLPFGTFLAVAACVVIYTNHWLERLFNSWSIFIQ